MSWFDGIIGAARRHPVLATGIAIGSGVVLATGSAAAATAIRGAQGGSPGRFGLPPNPDPFPLRGGFAHTLWTGGPLESAWTTQLAAVVAIGPQVVIIDVPDGGGLTLGAVVPRIRAAVPGVRIWLEVACNSPTQGFPARGLIDTAKRGADAGAECVVWNDEFVPATAAARATNAGRVRQVVEGCRRELPRVVQGHSAFATPNEHSGYQWAAWLGGRDATGTFGPGADFSLPQWYPFGDAQNHTIAAGEMITWANRFGVSWSRAVAKGWIPAALPLGVYLPSKYVPTADLVAVAQAFPLATFWPWHGSYDPNGEAAAEALAHGGMRR